MTLRIYSRTSIFRLLSSTRCIYETIENSCKQSLRNDGLEERYKLGKWITECCKLLNDSRLIHLLEIFSKVGKCDKLVRSGTVRIGYKHKYYVIEKVICEEIRSSMESPFAADKACQSLKAESRGDLAYMLRGNLILATVSLSATKYYEYDGLG